MDLPSADVGTTARHNGAAFVDMDFLVMQSYNAFYRCRHLRDLKDWVIWIQCHRGLVEKFHEILQQCSFMAKVWSVCEHHERDILDGWGKEALMFHINHEILFKEVSYQFSFIQTLILLERIPEEMHVEPLDQVEPLEQQLYLELLKVFYTTRYPRAKFDKKFVPFIEFSLELDTRKLMTNLCKIFALQNSHPLVDTHLKDLILNHFSIDSSKERIQEHANKTLKNLYSQRLILCAGLLVSLGSYYQYYGLLELRTIFTLFMILWSTFFIELFSTPFTSVSFKPSIFLYLLVSISSVCCILDFWTRVRSTSCSLAFFSLALFYDFFQVISTLMIPCIMNLWLCLIVLFVPYFYQLCLYAVFPCLLVDTDLIGLFLWFFYIIAYFYYNLLTNKVW